MPALQLLVSHLCVTSSAIAYHSRQRPPDIVDTSLTRDSACLCLRPAYSEEDGEEGGKD